MSCDKRVEELESLWAEFIKILKKTEISDSGTEFHPNGITSCRVLDTKRMNEILTRAEEMVNE